MSDEITLGNISSLSSPATDLIARAAGPLIEGDYFFREFNQRASGSGLHDRSLRPHHVLQRGRCCTLGLPAGARQERLVRFVETLLAGWPGIAARSMSDGCCSEGAASDPGRGSGS